MTKRIFGHISGYSVGATFASRQELSKSGIHRPLQAGISGSGIEGADSIVLSGGYEDDVDYIKEIIYTGQGGRDTASGKQDADQTLTRGNLALAVSQLNGLAVRVIRGSNHAHPLSPKVGYRYDGLYRVEDHWREKGKSGHYVWRFRLVQIEEPQLQQSKAIAEPNANYDAAPLKATTILRIVRDTNQARLLKQLYDFRCQVCGTRLETAAGPYAEAAHIQPLGKPHNGPDVFENMLCLCPNHHVLFDAGAFSIDDDLAISGSKQKLEIHPSHAIDKKFLAYHREHYLNSVK